MEKAGGPWRSGTCRLRASIRRPPCSREHGGRGTSPDMSLINQMLQDLDRRQSGPGFQSAIPPHVQPVAQPHAGREWFWRTVAILVLAALGWVAWVAYQMWPRPVATEAAYRSAELAHAHRAAAVDPAPSPAPAAAPPPPPAGAPASLEPAPAAVSPAPDSPASAVPTALQNDPSPAPPPAPETFRLAQSIETPIIAPAPKRIARPVAKSLPPPSAAKAEAPKVERRDRVTSPAERAENEFRYAAAVLKLGRATEAEAHFAKALELD